MSAAPPNNSVRPVLGIVALVAVIQSVPVRQGERIVKQLIDNVVATEAAAWMLLVSL